MTHPMAAITQPLTEMRHREEEGLNFLHMMSDVRRFLRQFGNQIKHMSLNRRKP